MSDWYGLIATNPTGAISRKMNRGRSSDSLNNGDRDIVCSSSGSSPPSQFTSDDEENENRDILRDVVPSRFAASRDRCKNVPLDILLNSFDRNKSILYTKDNAQSSAIEVHQRMSQRDMKSLNRNVSYLPDILPQTSSQDYSYQDDVWERDHLKNSTQRRRAHLGDTLGLPTPSNRDAMDSVIDDTCGDEDIDLYMPNDWRVGPNQPVMDITSRDVNPLTNIMCAKLVECRNLIEAIEFVERNRSVIDELTRIITHDAPAYRNYDMSNYQTDYSVKDSFNPHFWLDREPVVTTADGNCQYHAISLSLTGTETYTPEVKLATAVAVIDNRDHFDSMLKLIDRGTVLDLVHTIARNYSWGDETTLKAVAVAINRRIFLYTCNIGRKDYELVKLLSKDELLDAFREKKYRGGTGIHTYADPFIDVSPNNYIMLFHKSEHFIAVLSRIQQPTMFEPYNPIVPDLM